jgi:hypothetical protein
VERTGKSGPPFTTTLDVMPTPTAHDAAARFQDRRSEVRRRSVRWAFGIVPAFVAIPLLGILELDQSARTLSWLIIGLLTGLAFYSAFRIVGIVNELYRCPVCEKLVTEKDGIALKPSSCPHCGATLGATERA